MNVQRSTSSGRWVKAEAIGWREEHNWLARFLFWVRGVEHCNEYEGRHRK